MALPSPPYPSSAASVSRSKTSRDGVRSTADEMLRSSLSGGERLASSPASVSRSSVSRDKVRSIADEMLRSSLSDRVSTPTSRESASRSTTLDLTSSTDEALQSSLSGRVSLPAPSASMSRSTVRNNVKSSADEMLRLSLSEARGVPSESLYSASISPPPPYISGHPPNLSPSRVTATSPKSIDTVKLRKFQLQDEVDRANAAAIRRSTEGLFQAACSTDLLFLIDTTSSMTPYIEAAKQQVRNIVADIKDAFLNESNVRIAVVSYKDHGDKPHIEFLDFTTSADDVTRFLDTLRASGGADLPEDVLGGIRQALQASWKQQTRCLVHIADAPSHGSPLHDLDPGEDTYYIAGSEPHGLTYEPLLRRVVQLKINYALLRITSWTDRMALAFAGVYGHENAKLFTGNTYCNQVNMDKGTSSGWSSSTKTLTAEPQFEESQLGTTYSELRHLVVRSVTTSMSRTAGRLSLALAKESKPIREKMTRELAAINEDETMISSRSSSVVKEGLERVAPQWTTPGWLDERLEVEGFCPAVVVHDAHTLGDMMAADENIKLSVAELTIYARSKPFARGALRVASYAQTAASTSRFVIKSFIKEGHGRADVAEDMRMQTLCKAFALEFNGLLKVEPPLDFLVTSCLQRKSATSSGKGNECLSLERFIEGDFVKYNNNGGWVNDELAEDRFNQIAQAFSHFTFERSWGHFLVDDIQGRGHQLTDPSIQTLDPERFKLNDTNLHEEGFKFFFATHKCNSFCEELGLKSNGRMFVSDDWEFRERWPTMDPTVCCSNKLCRNIIRLASAHRSEKFLGHHWCGGCWSQLQESTVSWICAEPGRTHEFEVSRFFHESQGQFPPKKCPDHREKDATGSSAAAVGGGIWNRMKSKGKKGSISGKSW